MGGVCVHVFVFVCVCWGYIHRWAFWGSSDFMCLLWLFSTLSSEVVSLTWTQNSLTWLVYLGSSPPGFPVSIVQAVRLYVRHHVHPELRQMLAIWTAVFMLASIYCSIFSRPKHIFNLLYTYLFSVCTCTYMYVCYSKCVAVKLQLAKIGSLLPSWPCPPWWRTSDQNMKLSGRHFAHQATLLAPKWLLYLTRTRTHLLSRSFVFAYF